MDSSTGEKTPSGGKEKSFFREFFDKLRKRHIIETLAAFIGGGWLNLEFVDRLLVAHYHFPDETIDLTFITILAALICTILWRWFRGTEKRPGNVKVEVLLVPLIILTALCIDLNILFDIAGISGKKLLIGIIALCLGIAWIVFKSLQWAAITPEAAVKKFDISKLVEIKPEKSIVVLPFADLSPQKDQEYFCDGITEEIITDLSYLRDLRVISRSSAMSLKGSPKPVREVAKELGVHYVLEGSVRKAGNDLRITVQLIDAINDAHLWADKLSGMLDDVFAMQEKISRSIVDTLKLKIGSEEKEKFPERPIENIHAYECYLRARQEIWRCTEDSLARAMQLIKNGLEIAGENDILYSQMGIVFAQYINMSVSPDERYLQKAEECAEKAFKLNPRSSQARYLNGFIQWKRGNVQNGVKELKQSLVSDPNNPDVLMLLSYFYGFSGKAAAAWPLLNRVVSIDPLTPVNYNVCGWVNLLDGKFAAALDAFTKMYQMEPENTIWRFFYSLGLIYNNRPSDALDIMEMLLRDSPKGVFADLTSFLKHALKGNKALAQASVTEGLVNAANWDEQLPWEMGIAYVLIDEKQKATDWLEIAVSRGWFPFLFLNEYDPFLANIRGEPRFKKLMERVKYEWEHFEV